MNDKPNYEALYLRERHRNDDWRRFAAWLWGDSAKKLTDDELRSRALVVLATVGVPKSVWRERDPLP